MNKKIEDMIAESKLTELLHRNEAEKQKNTVIWVLAIIGAVAAVAAIAYAVYRQDVVDGLHPACFAVMKQSRCGGRDEERSDF